MVTVRPELRIQIRSAPRDFDKYPSDDDALGKELSTMVAGALARGLPRPAVLVVRSSQIDWLDAVPILSLDPPNRQRMMAAIAGQEDVECMALMGTFKLRRRRQNQREPTQQRALLCFIEWPDCRWWSSSRLLGEHAHPIAGDALIRAAVDGWPRPGGVGGWFSMARRLGVKLQMVRAEPPVMVH